MPEKKQKPDTALDEVLHEVESAEKRVQDPDGKRGHKGEAADATTPNTRAQEESEGE
ncbi:hypothetical protein OG426_49130 [Streptomyces canus]|nr:hypothetical protein [Streptomyces canus]MCX4854759.1 hypothetical protein [Streptomyces canus]WSW39831.1 hypothetical protein OG426_49130 [Streptomyces canus]